MTRRLADKLALPLVAVDAVAPAAVAATFDPYVRAPEIAGLRILGTTAQRFQTAPTSAAQLTRTLVQTFGGPVALVDLDGQPGLHRQAVELCADPHGPVPRLHHHDGRASGEVSSPGAGRAMWRAQRVQWVQRHPRYWQHCAGPTHEVHVRVDTDVGERPTDGIGCALRGRRQRGVQSSLMPPSVSARAARRVAPRSQRLPRAGGGRAPSRTGPCSG